MTSELFLVSLVVLLLVLMVLMVLCWILSHNRSRHLTELKISAGQPTRILTIKTEPDHAQQILDHLLDRIFLQVECRPGSGYELGEEPGAEPGEELGGESGSYSGSDQKVSTAASLPNRAMTALHNKLWKWITVTSPPPASPPLPPSPPPPPPPPPSPTSQDRINVLSSQQLGATQHTSLPAQGASCSYWIEEQHDEPQL